MRVNNHIIRYVGEVYAANYSVHTREFLSLSHAVETLRDLPFGTESDEILLFACEPWESQGEAHSRTNSTDYATHIVKRGPRGGVKVERV